HQRFRHRAEELTSDSTGEGSGVPEGRRRRRPMTFRSRLTFLEKKVAPDDDLSHLTDQELLEQLWELFRISKARHGEEVTEAEDQLFRIDPEQALVDSERWTLEH